MILDQMFPGENSCLGIGGAGAFAFGGEGKLIIVVLFLSCLMPLKCEIALTN
jgi:hypothetical protein